MRESRNLFSESNRCFSLQQFRGGEVETTEIGGALKLTVDVVDDDEGDQADEEEGQDEGPGGDQGLGPHGGDTSGRTQGDSSHFTHHKVVQHYPGPGRLYFI